MAVDVIYLGDRIPARMRDFVIARSPLWGDEVNPNAKALVALRRPNWERAPLPTTLRDPHCWEKMVGIASLRSQRQSREVSLLLLSLLDTLGTSPLFRCAILSLRGARSGATKQTLTLCRWRPCF